MAPPLPARPYKLHDGSWGAILDDVDAPPEAEVLLLVTPRTAPKYNAVVLGTVWFNAEGRQAAVRIQRVQAHSKYLLEPSAWGWNWTTEDEYDTLYGPESWYLPDTGHH